jgi:hypothetical protein
MSEFSEMQIYQKVKQFMSTGGWHIIGGQPPSGTDHHPVIEIKDPDNLHKGSKGSLKPDLIALFENFLYVVELKPSWNATDREKLLGFLDNQRRIDAFYSELSARNIRSKEAQLISSLRNKLEVVGALGYAGSLRPDKALATFHVIDAGEVRFTPAAPENV